MRILNVLMVCTSLAFAATSAFAEVKGPKGEKCDQVETKVKRLISNKPYICDKCVVKPTVSCDASGKKIEGCVRTTTTHYVNCDEDRAEIDKQKKAEAEAEAKKKADAEAAKKKAADEAAKKKAADDAAKKKADAVKGGKS